VTRINFACQYAVSAEEFEEPDRIGSKLYFDKERSTVGINNNEVRNRPNLFTDSAESIKSGVVLHEVLKDRFVAETIESVAC
jgi:hypothetical protein